VRVEEELGALDHALWDAPEWVEPDYPSGAAAALAVVAFMAFALGLAVAAFLFM
jgi:hypothetical protein